MLLLYCGGLYRDVCVYISYCTSLTSHKIDSLKDKMHINII